MSEDRESIQMFDDGSKAFKLLYNELKDDKIIFIREVKDVAVKDTNDYMLQIFAKADPKTKTYLHYTADDLRENKEAKRRAIEKVERVGFKNKIVLPYEGMDNHTVDERYDKLPKEDIKLTGKPLAIALDMEQNEIDNVNIMQPPYVSETYDAFKDDNKNEESKPSSKKKNKRSFSL